MDEPNKPRFREGIPYQALLLGGFATLATALLVTANLATKDVIRLRQQEDLQAFLAQVIPPAQNASGLLENKLQLPGPGGKPVTLYRGIGQGRIKALAWELSGKGYAGPIRLILGLDAEGKILGVRVLSHTETPGLGDKIEVQKDDWILGFNGLSLGDPPEARWKVKKDGGQFDAFSGATITPRGVVGAIREGLRFFADHRAELLEPPRGGQSSGRTGP